MTLQEDVKRLTADEALAFLTLVKAEKATDAPAPQPDKVASPSPVAILFTGWLFVWQTVNAADTQDLTDENMKHFAAVLGAAEDAILALPVRGAVDIWRQTVVALAEEGIEPGSRASKLLASAYTALGIPIPE